MKDEECQINSSEIKGVSEETSTIASKSYKIENANDNHLDNARIYNQIENFKKVITSLPILNMSIVLLISRQGTTAMAFLNKDTRKVIVGMTGTNVHLNNNQKYLTITSEYTSKLKNPLLHLIHKLIQLQNSNILIRILLFFMLNHSILNC